jgi:EAL domain-containing protein (putative c-di-GMP-specific phosphodiesterase class I)
VAFDQKARSLTQALVSLAHGLGMKVVIEGVETWQQLEAIRRMGCDMAQGYLIGRPAAPAVIQNVIPLGEPQEALLAG